MLSAPVVTARQIRDDALHEFFCAAHDVVRHLVHDHHPDDRPAPMGYFDQAQCHDHLLVHPDAPHLGHDPALRDLASCDHPNLRARVHVATPEFDACVHSSMVSHFVAAVD